MTTKDYNYQVRQNRQPGTEESVGVSGYGFADPDGQYPSFDYFFNPSISLAARGKTIETVWLGGLELPEGLTLEPPMPSTAGKNFAKSTPSGHHISFDDTRGTERVTIKHKTGAGVEMRADGTVIISATENKIEVTGGDQVVTVEGNGKLVYKGNLDLDVTGDLNISCTDFNLNTRGSYTETVKEHHRSSVGQNQGMTVKGNQSNTILGVSTNAHLNGLNQIVKGPYNNTVEGDSKFTVSGTFTQSVPTASYRSNGYTVDANTLTLIGGAGNIGGQDVTFGGKGAKFSEGVTAPTFHGDLDGNAKNTYKQAYGETATSGGGSIVDTNTPTFTVQPKTNQTTKLAGGTTGVKTVKIDEGDYFKNQLDKLYDTGGCTPSDITSFEAAVLTEDENIANNTKFLGWSTTTGLISPQFSKTTPPAINRIINSDTPVYGTGTIGNNAGNVRTISFKTKKGPATILPDSTYNPMARAIIKSDTKLAPAVPISKFLGTKLFPVSWKNFPEEDHKQIARNLYPIAQIYRDISNNTEKFKDYVPEIIGGLYVHKGTQELKEGSPLDLATDGRSAWIRLKNSATGKQSNAKTFELAEHISNTYYFDELRLHYKNFDPSLGLAAYINIMMPEISDKWQADFDGHVYTYYNNVRQGEDGELMEVVPESVLKGTSSKPTTLAGEGVVSYGILPEDGVVLASNPDPTAVPQQHVIDSIALAVRALGPNYTARITPNGGIADRKTGTKNHPTGEAADHYLQYNGSRINPVDNQALYKRYITILVLNAYNRGIRPGIGGYKNFIHYDESDWRQGGSGLAGGWNNGFNVLAILDTIRP